MINNYSINQSYCYILIIPAFGIISTTISTYSNKSVFGYISSSLIKIHLLMQQTICRKVSSFLGILLSTPFNWKFINSIVKILVVSDNPQITNARSENFKPDIKEFIGLSMLVGISEAIRLWSTLLFTNYLSILTINFALLFNSLKHYNTLYLVNLRIKLNYVLFHVATLFENITLKIKESDNSEINKEDYINDEVDEYDEEDVNEPKSSHNFVASLKKNNAGKENERFYEWLAGIIDGDGCFLVSKKGYCSLEIVTQLRDKKILYLIKQKFGGSVKLISGNNHLRYRLHHKEGLLKLINKINGLIRNPIRILQLGRICEIYGVILKDPKPLTYYSGWLAGFIDTDGSIYFNEASGQLFITAVQKNRFLLEALVELYGGRIYPMVKQEAFKWNCYRKKEVLALVNDYFKVNPCRSEKMMRISMVNDFYRLRNLHAHSVSEKTDLGKAWKYFMIKWNSFMDK